MPTMLIQGNKPIVESANIIQYMDDNFDGTTKLLQRDNDNFMTKYQEFYNCHEKWNVAAFTFGHFFKQNIFMKKSMPIMISGMVDRIFALKE